MHITPGPTRYAVRNVDTAESAFQLFLTPSLLQQIIDWTNKEGQLVYGHQWADVDNIEMHCYLGLLILAGVMKGHNESVMSLWNEENGRAIFNQSMARNRFTAISRCIRFDDAAARRRTRSTDKLAPIRDVFELWVKSFQDCYIPNENVTVDEQLVTFRGRCPFRQFIPSKPGKYGIKIWALCDSVTSYVYNMQVYTGREGQNREVNQGQRVVLDLVSGLEKSRRNVTCDNFFTSISLARELAKRQMTVLGTIRTKENYQRS